MYHECSHCGQGGEGINVTINYSPALGRLFPERGFDELDGKAGAEALKLLRSARSYLADYRTEIEALMPSNGWGTYDHLREMLDGMIQRTEDSPSLVWRYSP